MDDLASAGDGIYELFLTSTLFYVWRRFFFDHELVHLVLTRTTSSFIFANASSLIKWWVWKLQQSWWCLNFTKHHGSIFHLWQQRDVNGDEVGTPGEWILVWILYSNVFVLIQMIYIECVRLIWSSFQLQVNWRFVPKESVHVDVWSIWYCLDPLVIRVHIKAQYLDWFLFLAT